MLCEVETMDDGRNVKCPRCWHWHGVIENFDNLCDKCCFVVCADHLEHEAVPGIRAAMTKQRIKYIDQFAFEVLKEMFNNEDV